MWRIFQRSYRRSYRRRRRTGFNRQMRRTGFDRLMRRSCRAILEHLGNISIKVWNSISRCCRW
jgi:hypothetical protein